MKQWRRWMLALAVASVCGGPFAGVVAQSPDESARRLYESGLAFMQQQKYAEAMKDFDGVVTSFPSSAVAADALLQMMTHQLEVARDPATARTTADLLVKKYPLSDSASMAYIISGRSVLAASRGPADLDTALATFERVPRLFPRSEAVPVSLYYAAETLRIAGRLDESIDRYRDVAVQYPRSIWAARAALGMATCFSLKGAPHEAFGELQRVRMRFPGTPEAAQALAANTTLFRLFLTGTPQAAYAFSGRAISGPAGKLKDVIALATDAADNVIVANRQAVMVFKADGTFIRAVSSVSAEGLFRDAAGGLVVLGKAGFQPEKAQLLALSVPKPDNTPKRLEDLKAAVTVSTGDVLVADGDSKTILRFSMQGKPLGRFAGERGERLAINALDEVAVLDGDAKTLALLDRTGKVLHRIAEKGPGYQLRNPVDVTYDRLGHVFVLDRAGAVLVFDRSAKLVSTFSIPEKTAGAFRGATAFTLDSAGRLLIYDNDTERVQIYQ